MKHSFKNKIFSLNDFLPKLAKWRSDREQIVFTNGCFDLLHFGHIDYLEHAAALGDRLIVGVNSDSSVSHIKGPHRPIQDEDSRMAILAALACVDAVILFSADTPGDLIIEIKPDVLIKGGDWNIADIVGGSFVLSYGGKVQTIPYIDGYSTSNIEIKIKKYS